MRDFAPSLKKASRERRYSFELRWRISVRRQDLFRPVYDRTNGVDGWVSLEVSPPGFTIRPHHCGSQELACARWPARTSHQDSRHPGRLARHRRSNLCRDSDQCNSPFFREHYLAAAEAFLRGIERRMEAGLKPGVGSVASVFVSRWDGAVMGKVPEALRNQLGIAIAGRTYKAARALLSSPRWQRIYSSGAWPQRLLWASTGTKDPQASDVLYIKALAGSFYRKHYA